MSLSRGLAGRRKLEFEPHEHAERAGEPNETMWLKEAFFGAQAYTGKRVTIESALGFDAVVACVRLLSESIGSFPIKTYQRDARGSGRTEVPGHPTYALLHDRPNWEMAPAVAFPLAVAHLVTWGDSFLGKTFEDIPYPIALWPVRPDRVRIERRAGQKLYWVKNEQGIEDKRPYDASTMIHVQGFSLDGLRGLSPIGLAREAIGAGLAMDEYANRFFSKGAVPSATMTAKESLTPGARRRLERWAQRNFGGLKNMHRVALLEEGVELKPYSFPLKDLEFVALHASSARKVARIYRVPASMIDASDGDASLTYRTVEGDNIQLLLHTFRPYLKRFAQTLTMDVTLNPPRDRTFQEHVVDELLLMDALSKAKVRQISGGGRPWRNPSEFREEDNLPPIEGIDDEPPPAAPAPEPRPNE